MEIQSDIPELFLDQLTEVADRTGVKLKTSESSQPGAIHIVLQGQREDIEQIAGFMASLASNIDPTIDDPSAFPDDE